MFWQGRVPMGIVGKTSLVIAAIHAVCSHILRPQAALRNLFGGWHAVLVIIALHVSGGFKE
jgi:fucose 4-O-acetylase-like acetyltransferase